MKEDKQSYFGQGPKMFRPAVLWALVAVLAVWLWPDVFRITIPVVQLSGWVLVVLGAALYFWGLMHMVRAVKRGQLDTSGPFALVRHPMYSAWIVLLFPGIALASGAWLIVGSAVIAWLFFRKWVQDEEQTLVDLFGLPYEEYMARVPALIPFTAAKR